MLPAIHSVRASGVVPAALPAASGSVPVPAYAGQYEQQTPGVRPSATVYDDILQGEVLTKRRPIQFQSTHAYLDERRFESARPASSPANGGRPAIAADVYQRHLQSPRGSEQASSIDVKV